MPIHLLGVPLSVLSLQNLSKDAFYLFNSPSILFFILYFLSVVYPTSFNGSGEENNHSGRQASIYTACMIACQVNNVARVGLLNVYLHVIQNGSCVFCNHFVVLIYWLVLQQLPVQWAIYPRVLR